MKKKFAALFAIFTLVLVLPISVFAKSNKDISKIVTLSEDQVVEDDYFAFGDRVEIHGTVEGDVYAFAGEIFIDGTIEGDLIAAGGLITMAGEVMQDARIAGGEITITGTIARNASIAAGNIDITDSAVLGRNVHLAAGLVNYYAQTAGNMYVGAGTLSVSGDIGGNLETAGGMLRVADTANIGGDFYYMSDDDYQISSSASISGTVQRRETPEYFKSDPQAAQNALAGFAVASKIISILSTVLFGYLLIRFMPKYSDRASELVKTSFWKSLFIGFGVLILGPIAAVLAFVSLIGFPIGVMIVATLIVYTFVARIYVMIAIGKKVEDWTNFTIKGKYYHFFVGLVAYYLLCLIPVIGGLVKFVVVVAGFGAAIRNMRNTYFIGRGKKIF